jgi:hypothetical protein
MGFEDDIIVKKSTEVVIEDKPLGEYFKVGTKLPPIRWLKIAIWGRAKVGKTHFSMTNPKGKIFIIDTEGSAKTNIWAFDEDIKERIFVFDLLENTSIEDGNIDYPKTLALLEHVIKKISQEMKNSDEPITIVVDSATDIWDWLGIWLDELPGVAHIGKDKDKVNRLEWGKANKRYADMFRNLMMSGCNVIMTFRAKDAVDGSGCNLGYFIPRWQKNTDYWIDVIAQLDKEGTKRILRFKGGRLVDGLPDLEDPTWAKMTAHIAKHRKVKFE